MSRSTDVKLDPLLQKSDLKIKNGDGRLVEGVVGPCEVKIGGMPFLLEMMVLPPK